MAHAAVVASHTALTRHQKNARKASDSALYQRAVEIALQSRSGDAALQAARAWQQALPDSKEASRSVLQILIALNRIQDTLEPLKKTIDLATPTERLQVISGVPRAYARVSDKKLASTVIENALSTYVINPTTSATAWTTISRMRLAAADTTGALTAAQKGRLLEYCRRADAVHSRCFGDCGLLLVLGHRTPNNSVPVLHAHTNKWHGLFPRH